LYIDRLVVDGLPTQGKQRFVRALEAQLTRLANDGMSTAFAGGVRRIAKLDAGLMRAGATPEQVAAQVTAALRGSLAGKEANRHA
jgi:hypothetical protein